MAKEFILKVLMVEKVANSVSRFVLEKPEKYSFVPGQATMVAINKDGWKDKKRPFTFTSLNNDLVLQFVIKSYDRDNAVTKELRNIKPGDEFILEEPWGAIEYKGKGIFIAGGAGITPFIAILKELDKKNGLKGNKLIFSNKTKKDIIYQKEFESMFDDEDLIFVLTEKNDKRIDKNYLKENISDFNQYFYLCGPKQMVLDIKKYLIELGVKEEKIVTEGL